MKLYSKSAISSLFGRNSQGTKHHESRASAKCPPAILEPLEPRILLSADLSYGGGDTALDLDLRLDPTDSSILQLIDNTIPDTIIGNLALDLTGTNTVEIIGSTQDDTLNIDLDSPSALGLNISFLDANAADSDTLVGPTGNSTWNITGSDAGDVEGVDFSGIENLTGAANNEDTFVFTDGGSLSGLLEGGYAGFDTLEVAFSNIQSLIYDATGPDSGVINADGNIINFVGLEPITVSGSSPSLTVDVDASPQDLTLEVVGGTLRVAAPGIEDITTSLGSSVIINFGTGIDSLTIGDVTGFDLNNLTVNFGTGDDTLYATASEDMALSGSQLTIGSDAIDFTGLENADLTINKVANELRTFSMEGWTGKASASRSALSPSTWVDSSTVMAAFGPHPPRKPYWQEP